MSIIMKILSLLLFVVRSILAEFYCIGTCYSGDTIPDTRDIFKGKHLQGFSYKNITTDDQGKCYRHCVQDCRCKACQIKGNRCELLDEDKTSTKLFDTDPKYSYIELTQTIFHGKSHKEGQANCQNGCCRSNPCLNGGACVEHCNSPKKKFSCTCRAPYRGKTCKQTLTSCLDVIRYAPITEKPVDGVYIIQRNNDQESVYCSFEVDERRAWTLIESYSYSNNLNYYKAPFQSDVPTASRNPRDWSNYRATQRLMKYLRRKSNMFRVTCDFPVRSPTLLPDYLLGNLKDYDIINNSGSGCHHFLHINIGGKDFFNRSAFVRQTNSHFYMNACDLFCLLPIGIGCNFYGGFFGLYFLGIGSVLGKTTTCNKNPNSTSNYWLGQEVSP